MKIRLSPYGDASTVPSPVNRMMAAFATEFRDGIDVNLGVGYVNERTIPDRMILDALGEVAAHPEYYRQPFNYGGPHGSPNLIRAIRRFYLENGLGGLDEETLAGKELIIGPSGATSILDAIADVIAPGIVVTADPMYYIYCDYLERKGFEVVTVPEDHEGASPELLEERISRLGPAKDRLSFFYFVTVNNPSCTILSNARRRRLIDAAGRVSRNLGRSIPLFFDQAYEWLLHDCHAERMESGLLHDPNNLVYELGTLSKVLAPALRIGFLIGPPGPLMRALVQKTSDVGFSAPLMNQEITAYLLDHCIQEQLARVNAGYREKACAVKSAIERHLAPYLMDCRGGRAGFYYYLTFSDVETHTDSAFFRYLTRTTGDAEVDGPELSRHPRVIYIPGEYCIHPRGESVEAGRRQLRLSYGFEATPTILNAIATLRNAADYALGKGARA